MHASYQLMDGDSSDENDLQCQAFIRPPPVDGDDLSTPPMDGTQYLRRVIEESKKCKSVVVATIEQSKLQQNLTVPYFQLPEEKGHCSIDLLPNKDWQLTALDDFSQLRLDIEALRQKLSDECTTSLRTSLPHKEDDGGWLKICLQHGPDVVDSLGPSTKLCLTLSQVKLVYFLSYFGDWLSHGELGVQEGCRWIYCLLACLELPVEPDVHFSLRQIVRALSNHRARLESQDCAELPHINLLICIIGRYFDQIDLADPYM